jgi:4-diphosphocytidyl-2-C-methyl-D-erythritol kinase
VPEISLVERLSAPIEEWQPSVKNDFERSVFAAHPRLKEIKEQLLAGGATYAAMSGSGSTIFGIFKDATKAEAFRGLTPYIYEL